MPKVELIYDPDCPNVGDAREQLGLALSEARFPLRWQEWDRSHELSPSYVVRYGSPTVLVDGKDVAGLPPSDGAYCCRLYRNGDGRSVGAPPAGAIVSALAGCAPTWARPKSRRQTWLATLPAVGVALLPKVACPACWPAYAGLLSSVGLGFLMNDTYLLPLTLVFLTVAVFTLGFRAARRRGYGPLALGLCASVLVAAGKFALHSDATLYGGIGLLVVASVWNSWPKRICSVPCPACAPTGTVQQIRSTERN